MSKQNGTGISPASAWRQLVQEGKEVTLPNGLTVRLRSVTVGYLLKTGKLPDGLTAVAMGALNEIENVDSPEYQQELAERMKKIEAYYEILCAEAFVSPRIVENPDPDKDEIAYEWLSEHDKQFVEGVINQPVVAWDTFCERYHSGLEPVRENEGNGNHTE